MTLTELDDSWIFWYIQAQSLDLRVLRTTTCCVKFFFFKFHRADFYVIMRVCVNIQVPGDYIIIASTQ